jgi:hypothetical protein
MADRRKSSKSGNQLEQSVISVFSNNGFEVINYSDWKKKPDKFSKEVLLKHVPYQSIYGHKGFTEFVALSAKWNMRIRIECKWQQSAGSVDEKLPYLYLNIIETMEEDEFLILIDGDGFKQGAIRWLREAVNEKHYTTSENRYKNIHVFSLTEFLTWANDTFFE